MKKTSIWTILIGFFLSVALFAAEAPEKIQKDRLQLGKTSSSAAKEIIFDTADGASNKKFSIDKVTKELTLDTDFQVDGDLSVTGKSFLMDNETDIGAGAGADIKLRFDEGSLNKPTIQWNETRSKLQFSNDGTLFKDFGTGSGGGGGGYNILVNPGFEDGYNEAWSNSGGTFDDATTSPDLLFGEVSATFDASSSGQYFQSDAALIPDILKDQACEASITYKGADTNYALKVKDGSDADLTPVVTKTFEIAGTNAVTVTTFFRCPSSGSLKLRVESTANGAIGSFDEAYLGSLRNLAESTLPDVFSAKVSNAGVVSDENVNWINGNCTNANPNVCSFVSGIFTASPNCTATPVTNSSRIYTTSVSTSSVSVQNENTSGSNVSSAFVLTCQKSTDAKQSVQVYKSIPKVNENVNEVYSTINAGGTTSSETPSDWINGSCSKSGTSSSEGTCTPNAGTFSQTPICECTVNDASSSAASCQIINTTSSSSIVYKTFLNNSPSSLAVNLRCKKTGADFKMPVVQPIVFPQGTEYTSVTSSIKTPAASAQYMAMTGNSIVVPTGQEWELNGSVTFLNSGASPGYTSYYVDFFTANGADSGSQPTNITPLAGLATAQLEAITSQAVLRVHTGTVRVGAGTYYLVPFAGMSTPSNARVTAYINARRVK